MASVGYTPTEPASPTEIASDHWALQKDGFKRKARDCGYSVASAPTSYTPTVPAQSEATSDKAAMPDKKARACGMNVSSVTVASTTAPPTGPTVKKGSEGGSSDMETERTRETSSRPSHARGPTRRARKRAAYLAHSKMLIGDSFVARLTLPFSFVGSGAVRADSTADLE